MSTEIAARRPSGIRLPAHIRGRYSSLSSYMAALPCSWTIRTRSVGISPEVCVRPSFPLPLCAERAVSKAVYALAAPSFMDRSEEISHQG
ncbi:hypothetical protein [Streptomyces sp. NPDC002588]|uniref:hypothetical protein n=1 Tax=Streptomyces sp. NPDC002588 TaxID=3154419 RepID=UPI00333185F6